MEVIVLGSAAAAVPGPGNAGSGYLVREGSDTLLVDVGNGVLGNLSRHADFEDVDQLLLSHLHYDHVLDIFPLTLNYRYFDRTLPVRAPDEAQEIFEDFYPLFSGDPDEYLEVLDVETWKPRTETTIEGFTVTPVPVEHNVPAYALRIERDGTTVTYSADTRACDALVEAADGADLLLCEATLPGGVSWGEAEENHMSAGDAGEVAREADVGHLALTHILYNQDPEDSLEQAEEHFGSVSVAHPNTVYPVSRPSPPR
jgi:ribonuclease BN (tRNA processing enzyme)